MHTKPVAEMNESLENQEPAEKVDHRKLAYKLKRTRNSRRLQVGESSKATIFNTTGGTMTKKYVVIRESTGEHVGTFATEAEAEQCQREEEAQDARLVERGWISEAAKYIVRKA